MALSTRQIKPKLAPRWEAKLKNVRINGNLVGCSGFVTEKESGRVIYLTTDFGVAPAPSSKTKVMYRMARSDRDYIGGYNRYCQIDQLGQDLASLFHKPDTFWRNELR